MRIFLFLLLFASTGAIAEPSLTGAWEAHVGDRQLVMILAEKQFAVVVQQEQDKAYLGTYGGNWKLDQSDWIRKDEFNTLQPETIGTDQVYRLEVAAGELILSRGAMSIRFARIDDGTPGQLAGAWLITGRKTDQGMSTMIPGARKTMKILSGTRFQWIAYNSETKEFLGTGGGTYTTANGKYTEHITFFSRDASRVGASLEFDFALEDGRWHHQGKSSKGDPIDEVWTKREKLGL